MNKSTSSETKSKKTDKEEHGVLQEYAKFYNKKELSCKVTQRSSDILLAGGWNITSASLFTILLAKICDLTPGDLIWSTGDTHIYLNQLEACKEQIKRIPKVYPKLYIKKKLENITDYKYDDLILINYNSMDKISIKMNA